MRDIGDAMESVQDPYKCDLDDQTDHNAEKSINPYTIPTGGSREPEQVSYHHLDRAHLWYQGRRQVSDT